MPHPSVPRSPFLVRCEPLCIVANSLHWPNLLLCVKFDAMVTSQLHSKSIDGDVTHPIDRTNHCWLVRDQLNWSILAVHRPFQDFMLIRFFKEIDLRLAVVGNPNQSDYRCVLQTFCAQLIARAGVACKGCTCRGNAHKGCTHRVANVQGLCMQGLRARVACARGCMQGLCTARWCHSTNQITQGLHTRVAHYKGGGDTQPIQITFRGCVHRVARARHEWGHSN